MVKKTKKAVSWQKKKTRAAYCFIAPFLIGMVVFLFIPVATSFRYSLSKLVINMDGYELQFKGLENYRKLLTVDPNYRKVLVSALMELINVPITLVFSFFMASVLNQKFKGRSIARAIFFLPVIFASGVYIRLERMDQMAAQLSPAGAGANDPGMASVFARMLVMMNLPNEVVGFMVYAVNQIGTIVSMSAIPIVIFIAGFQAVSPSIFEAAYMEGCTKWETFWKISFPMISPLILVCIVYSIVDNFTKSSSVMIQLVHQTIFQSFDFGMGSAMIWIYMIVVLIIIGIVYKAVNKYIFYYD